MPEYRGFARRDPSPSFAAGLTVRGVAETARDTLAWARAANGARTGLTEDEESAVLRAWHAR